jgi:hypothetical protein
MAAARGLVLLIGAGLLWPAAQAGDAPGGLDLRIGTSLLRFDFREYADTGEPLVRELGVLPGLIAGVGQTIGRWRWSAELSWYSGAVDYDGQTQSGAAFSTTSDATAAGIRARALHPLDPAGRLAAGVGFGYRQWQRKIRGRADVSGLEERFATGEVSVDARVSVLRSQAADVDLDLQLAWPVGPQLKTDFGSRYDPRTLMLGPRLATRVSLPAAWAVAPGSRIVVEPGFEAWGFGRSRTETLYRGGVPVGEVYQPRGRGYNLDLKMFWMQSF